MYDLAPLRFIEAIEKHDILHAFDRVIHKNDDIIEIYCDSSLNLHVIREL